MDIVADPADERLDRGVGMVRRAYPGTDIRVVLRGQAARADACVVRVRRDDAHPYAGGAQALSDGSAEVRLRRDFSEWTVYHEFGHLFRGHVCTSGWWYYFVELWPMDLHLLLTLWWST
jgi:hypothetical protein